MVRERLTYSRRDLPMKRETYLEKEILTYKKRDLPIVGETYHDLYLYEQFLPR